MCLVGKSQQIDADDITRELRRIFPGASSDRCLSLPHGKLASVPIVLAYNNSSSDAARCRELSEIADALGGKTLWPFVIRYFEP